VLDAAARARVAAFLEARRLPVHRVRQDGRKRSPPGEAAPLLELGETLLREGDAITVHGMVTEETAVGAGYRRTRQARVLGDGDQLPVLVSA
jgi:hypothetical protein